jgi:predicted NBD/HSP70 family sugar kinase
MRLANITKKYYFGIDIRAIKMVVCIKNQKGKTLLHQEIPSKMEPLNGCRESGEKTGKSS